MKDIMPKEPLNKEVQVSELKECIQHIKRRLDLILPLYERCMDKPMESEIRSLEEKYEDLLARLNVLLNEPYQSNDAEGVIDESKRKAINEAGETFDETKEMSSKMTSQKREWHPSKIKRSNSMIRDLNSSVKTVPLMDSFQESDKEYLLLGGVAPQCGIRDTYLVIHRFHVNIPHIKSGLMLYDLKKDGRGKLWQSLHNGLKAIEELNPWYPLCKEINRDNFAILQEENYFFFSKAVEFGAQTSLDRTGYGSVYQGGKTVFEGTRYGGTTSFLIVGATLTLRD